MVPWIEQLHVSNRHWFFETRCLKYKYTTSSFKTVLSTQLAFIFWIRTYRFYWQHHKKCSKTSADSEDHGRGYRNHPQTPKSQPPFPFNPGVNHQDTFEWETKVCVHLGMKPVTLMETMSPALALFTASRVTPRTTVISLGSILGSLNFSGFSIR